MARNLRQPRPGPVLPLPSPRCRAGRPAPRPATRVARWPTSATSGSRRSTPRSGMRRPQPARGVEAEPGEEADVGVEARVDRLIVQYRVQDGPDGPRSWHLDLTPDRLAPGPGKLDGGGRHLHAAVVVAAAVASGRRSATEALLTGDVAVSGDASALLPWRRRCAGPATRRRRCRARPMCRPTSRPAPRAPRRGDRMPELPEIQAHAERLTDAFAGRTLVGSAPDLRRTEDRRPSSDASVARSTGSAPAST